jgi:hypothetical protein
MRFDWLVNSAVAMFGNHWRSNDARRNWPMLSQVVTALNERRLQRMAKSYPDEMLELRVGPVTSMELAVAINLADDVPHLAKKIGSSRKEPAWLVTQRLYKFHSAQLRKVSVPR